MVDQVRVNLGSVMPVRLSRAEWRAPTDGVYVEARGHVGEDDVALARTSVAEVLARTGIRDGARIRLVGSLCAGGPVLAQVNLRVCGAPARVQLPGSTAVVGIGRVAARLERQIRRLTTAYEPRPWPDPERRPLSVPGAGAIRRRKTYRLCVASPCQAIAYMDAMDYDVMLFTDIETGQDAVVYRSGPTGVRLARQQSMRPPSAPVAVPLTVNSHRIPTLTTAEAAARLALGWLPFVFFTDRSTGRGALLYRRYDGDLGQITAA